MAKDVEWTATPAGARGQGEGHGQWERELKATQQEEAEIVGTQSRDPTRGTCGESQATPRPFMRSHHARVFASAIRSACEEILAGHEARAWKLLLLLPRMLLTKPRRDGSVNKKELEASLALFSAGEWHILMRQSVQSCEEASRAATRRSRRTRLDTIEHMAAKAERLVQLGEISPGRQWRVARLHQEICQHSEL